MRASGGLFDSPGSSLLAPIGEGAPETRLRRQGSSLYSQNASPGILPVELRLPRIAALKHNDTFPPSTPQPHYVPKPSVMMPSAAGGVGGSLVEQAQWKELAISYGLHLVPDTRDLLNDNLQSVLRDLPPPPSMTVKNDPAHAEEMEFVRQLQQPVRQQTDLGSSPSLPMLSPGRPGVRNWVTFLHGPPFKASPNPPSFGYLPQG